MGTVSSINQALLKRQIEMLERNLRAMREAAPIFRKSGHEQLANGVDDQIERLDALIREMKKMLPLVGLGG